MKLSKETVNVLKNFGTINSNVMLRKGSTINTFNAPKSVYASATITEDIPSDFGIYDLNEFLGVLTLFEEPDIDFDTKYLTIKQGKNSVKYFGADESVLTVPNKQINLPAGDISFKLTAEQISLIIKTSGVLRAPDVTIQGDGETLKVLVGDKKNVSANSYEMVVGETDQTFKAQIRVDNMKMVPKDYLVELVNKKVAKFDGGELMYALSLEADSEFED